MGFDINTLCNEIEGIYKALLELEISDSNGAKRKLLDPEKLNFSIKRGWLISQKKSVRDCTLESYGDKTMKGMVCKTSAIYTSQASMLDIDHFFPADKIQQRLEELKKDNKGATIKQLKLELERRIRQGESQIPKKILDQLISNSKPPKIEGLHTLYYNAPANIWPMAGTVNSGKGAKDSFSEAIYVMLNSILRSYGSEHFKDTFLKKLKDNPMFLGFTINPKLPSEQLIAKITQWATDKLSKDLDEEKTIVPKYSDGQTMLEKFLDSDLVRLIEEYRQQQQKIMGSAARNVTYINPENVSLSELLVFRKMTRALVKKFSGQQASSSSSSLSVSSPQDDSNISSQPLEQEELPIAFKMLGMVFESLKEDTLDEEEFVKQTMLTLKSSIRDPHLIGAIERSSEILLSSAKRSREQQEAEKAIDSSESSDKESPLADLDSRKATDFGSKGNENQEHPSQAKDLDKQASAGKTGKKRRLGSTE